MIQTFLVVSKINTEVNTSMYDIIRYINNTLKSYVLAKTLFPKEKWVYLESHIWVAKSRLNQKLKEPKKWEKEMSQAHILTSRGSVAFFLPERVSQGESGSLYADLILDGEVLGMKTITGTRGTLGKKFNHGYKQGASLLENCNITKRHSVFIRLLSDLSLISVMSKIAGELKNRSDQGYFICYFEKTGKLRIWEYNELKAIIGKK